MINCSRRLFRRDKVAALDLHSLLDLRRARIANAAIRSRLCCALCGVLEIPDISAYGSVEADPTSLLTRYPALFDQLADPLSTEAI